MTQDLTKKSKDLLDEVKHKSLTSKITDLKTKIANISRYKNLTLLCDVSGSMDSLVGEGVERTRAIDVVNEVVQTFNGAKIFEFSTGCYIVKPGSELRCKGSTNLGGAFKVIKSNSIKEIILVTDGQPDSEQDALREAHGLTINIIYIGPQPTPPFLTRLGNIKGNKIESVELLTQGAKGAEQIENKIKGFLGSGS